VLRELQIRQARRTPPELAYFTMPLAMLLAAYMAIISPGANDVDFLRFVLADGHRETTAHNVTEHVVEYEVEVFVVGAFFFKKLMAVITPRPAQPTPGSGPPDSTHLMSR
jgi:hypothetical protein